MPTMLAADLRSLDLTTNFDVTFFRSYDYTYRWYDKNIFYYERYHDNNDEEMMFMRRNFIPCVFFLSLNLHFSSIRCMIYLDI